VTHPKNKLTNKHRTGQVEYVILLYNGQDEWIMDK